MDTTEEGEKRAPLCVDREVSLYRTDLLGMVWEVRVERFQALLSFRNEFGVSPKLRITGIETVVFHRLEKRRQPQQAGLVGLVY